MPNHSFLPDLHEKNALGNLPAGGVWNDDGDARLRLASLAEAIVVPPVIQEQGKAHKIYSIPNPWARVILFDLALSDVNHILHAQTVGEWRGILAILALKEARGFDALDPQTVKLPTGNQPGSFAHVISGLRPPAKSLIDKNSTWDNFHILRWRSRNPGLRPAIFALTSPTTLVAAAASYKDALDRTTVPWFDGTILRDPIPHLSPHESKAMAEWATWVQGQVGNLPPSDAGRTIIHRLQEFVEALGGPVAARESRYFLAETNLKLGGVFNVISRPHNGESDLLTELEIVGDRKVEPGSKAPAFVLVDPGVPAEFNRKPNTIVAFRNRTLETMQRQPPTETHGPLGEGSDYTWCRPSFFFENFLIYQLRRSKKPANSDGAVAAGPFPGCRRIRASLSSEVTGTPEIVLPLSPEITRLFTPEYLHKNFSIEWLSDDEAICRLVVELGTVKKPSEEDEAPKLSGKREYTMEKRYSKAEGSLLPQTLLPIIGIWPNFRYPDKASNNRWKRYLLFESWNGMATTETRGEVTPNDFVVEPLLSSDERSPRRMITIKSVEKDNHEQTDTFQVSPMTRFPDFLVCRMPAGSSAPRLSNGRVPQGLLMLNAPKTPPAADRGTALLGIDFGTTGTAIYTAYRVEANESAGEQNTPRQVVFQNRFFPVVSNRDRNEFEQLTRQLFIPGKEWPAGKILSVLQDFGPALDNNARIAVRDAHVLFADPSSSSSSFILGNPDSIRSNFKWGGTERDILATKDFLTQLCIQSLAELVFEGAQRIEVRSSYPTAFSEKDIWQFHTNWKAIETSIKGKKTGNQVSPDAVTSVDIDFHGEEEETQNHEAIAATRFFASTSRLAYASGALTLDIGGGTTDLALWNLPDKAKVPHLMAHLSVRFAGRDLFRDPVLARPEILEVISESPLIIEGLRNKTGPARNAQLDAIIAKHGDELIDRLSGKEANPLVSSFLHIIELGLCGLAFYSGLLIGGRISAGKYKPTQKIPVFVGGNASKLLQWCAFGNFSTRSPIHKRFENSLLAGIKVALPSFAGTSIVVNLSEQPKQEVAFGLVARDTPIELKDAFTDALEGEDFKIIKTEADEQKPWSESLSPNDLIEYPIRVGDGMEIFARFLQSLDPESQDFSLDADELRELAARLTGELGHMAKEEVRSRGGEGNPRKMNSLRREPLFFMALKDLVASRIQLWKKIEAKHD